MRSFVICVGNLTDKSNEDGRSLSSSSSEFVALVAALHVISIIDKTVIKLKCVRSGTYFSSGKLSELSSTIKDKDIELVIIDTRLSPMQQRNLERMFEAKVMDRTGLILEIFGSRAQTREGVLQVQLAHLEYQKSRLVRSWTHLERQRGGVGFMGGPGETQIESDRRSIAEKIFKIRQQLDKVIQTRVLHRKNRKKTKIPVVALVGYTNAGKSSVFNFLTSSNVLSKDMLFATLDPTMRAFHLLNGKKVILSDTVGFISRLPMGLVSAFKATLEEVVNADLILHVRDISHSESKLQALDVESIIDELDWEGRKRPPVIELYNKIDNLTNSELNGLKTRFRNQNGPIFVSATSGFGFHHLKRKIWEYLYKKYRTETIFLNFNQSKKRAWLFDNNIVSRESMNDSGFSLTVEWSEEQKVFFNNI